MYTSVTFCWFSVEYTREVVSKSEQIYLKLCLQIMTIMNTERRTDVVKTTQNVIMNLSIEPNTS